jgi:hypothetical protein
VNSVTVQPSPASEHAGDQPTSGTLADEKKPAASNQPVAASEPAKKAEKAKTNAKTPDKVTVELDPDEAAGQDSNVNAPPAPPEVFIPNNVPNNARLNRAIRQMGVPKITNLPDGRQVMTFADGTRIVTMPDGSKRMMRPGGKVKKRAN